MQPEGHSHSTEQVARGRDRRQGRVGVTLSPIQATKPEMAMRLERSHAELVGKGQGFLVVLLRPVQIRHLALDLDQGEQPEGMRFMSPLTVLLRDVEPLRGKREGAIGSAGLDVCLGRAE